MSWYSPQSWGGWIGDKLGKVAGHGTDTKNYAPGSRYEAGAGTATTNADIEADKAKRIKAGLSALPSTYANGAQVRVGMDRPGGVDAQGTPTYAAQTLTDQTGQPLAWQVNDATRQALLAQQGSIAGRFGDQTQQGYTQYGQQANGALAGLYARAQGQNSISAEQLRQGQQQNIAAQRSLAASAAPQNSAGAARTAAIQIGRSNAGLAGQQALAGLEERNQANQQYGNLLQQLRGQDLNATISSRQNAETGYGAAQTGAPQKSWLEQYGPAIAGGASAVAASDPRLKKDVTGGDTAANNIASKLGAYAFRYKDPQQHGEGQQFGVMADELEAAGLKHAVMDTPGGKMVHGAKLATANMGITAALARRVAKLEAAK